MIVLMQRCCRMQRHWCDFLFFWLAYFELERVNVVSKHKFPYTIDASGNIVLSKDVPRGEIVPCPFCRERIMVKAEGPTIGGYLKTMIGRTHGNPICKRIAEGKKTKIRLINLTARLNKKSKPMVGEEKPDDVKKPRKSTTETNIYLFKDPQEIANSNLRSKEDFYVNDNEKLTDTFVSVVNAYVIMNNNKNIFTRMIEVYLDYYFQKRKTIRVIAKAKKNENQHPTAAQKVLDLVFEDKEIFDAMVQKLFISYDDENGKFTVLPRFKTIFVAGTYFAVPANLCSANGECIKWCVGNHIHCTGRQKVTIRAPETQLIVCEEDRIDYSIYNGWIPQSEDFIN